MIHCPSCNHAIRIVDIRPGRFNPRCPRCNTSFQLTVPAEGAGAPVVELIAQATPPAASEPEPSLEAIPTTPDAPETFLRLSRLPRGVPRLLGGYVVLKLLGHGPRGKSLLARPLSLAGRVVLKVVSADRAHDAVFVERYLREALASAQLSSPHLVPIVEIGHHGPSTFTALEYVPGASLAEEVAKQGRIEPRRAAAWILQAARGLAVAHAQGVWHRDVKPENLRLTRDGLIMVDDLGLETTPSLAAAESGLDKASRKGPGGRAQTASQDAAPPAPRIERAAVGTPIYMAPEQARDALIIDGRADVYSLGCTFYTLVTGRPPHAKATASELIASHQDEPLIPPQEFAPGLAPAIADVIQTMTRKAPEERYPSMDVVIDVLEGCLGLRRGSATAHEQAYQEAIQEASSLMNDAPPARLRRQILLGATGVWLAFLLLLIAMGAYRVAVVIAGFGALTGSVLALTSKSIRPSGLFDLLRELLLGDGLRSWLFAGFGLIVLLGLAVYGGLVGSLIFLGICIGGLLGGFHYFVERPFAATCAEAVSRVTDTLRRLRQAGYDERLLRQKLADDAGAGWEPLFAAVFGDRALEAERLRRLHDASAQFGTGWLSWKGTAQRVLSGLLDMRRDSRLRRLFQQVEEARFEAEGLNLMTARRRSWRISKAIVLAAAEWRDEQLALQGGGTSSAVTGPTLPQRLREAVESPEHILTQHESHPGPIRRKLESLLNLVFGRLTRLALGAALLGGLAVWLHSHEIVTAAQVGEAASEVGRIARQAAENADPDLLRDIHVDVHVERAKLFQPLGVPWLPGPLRSILAANLGVAGLLLVVASLFRSRSVGFFSVLAAAVVLLGPSWGLTSTWLASRFDAPAQAMLVGVAILIVGVLTSRR